MSENKPTNLNIDLADGYSGTFQAGDFESLQSACESLKGQARAAMATDEAEAKATATAAGLLAGPLLAAAMSAVGQGQNQILNGLIIQLDQLLTTTFAPRRDVVNNLMNTMRPKWDDSGSKVDTVKTKIAKHIELDEWQSTGANNYKSAATNQNNALSELQQLCFDASAACQHVAQINGAIFLSATQLVNTMTAVLTAMGMLPGVPGTYSRTRLAIQTLQQTLSGLHMLSDGTTAPWAPAATGINGELNTVRFTPANLGGTEGRWPEAKAGHEVKADAGEFASHTWKG